MRSHLLPIFIGALTLQFTGPAVVSAADITGVVVDAASDTPLAGVIVQVEGMPSGTTTDGAGRFTVPIGPAGTVQLGLNLIGFDKLLLTPIELSGADVDVGTVKLSARAIRLSEVVVTPGRYSIMSSSPIRGQTMGRQELENMSFAEDITRAVSRLPGVASTDFSSKFTIRGGEADEVLMSLDGMELYEPFHQRDFVGGLFSIVDIETIQGIDLLTGGFTAEYGNRESGVFNMTTKTPTQRNTTIGVSVMNVRLYTEGTLAGGEGSYLMSARRGVLDKIKLMSVVDDETTHFFHDAMAKVEMPVNDRHRLSAHVLLSGDRAEVRDVEPGIAHDIHNTSYDNLYGWLALKSIYSDGLYARSLLYGGEITHDRNGDTAKDEYTDKVTFQLRDNRSYRFFGLKQDWIWDVSPHVSLKSGFDLKQVNAEYDYVFNLDDTRTNSAGVVGPFHNNNDIQTKPSGQQTGVYLSTRFNPWPDLYVETGLRNDRATWADDNLWSPRLSGAYNLTPRTVLRGGWGKYYQSQFINNLDVHHSAADFDPAELSTHYVVGLEHNFDYGIHARVEGYRKQITRLSDSYQNLRDPWEVFPEARNDDVLLRYDGAETAGVELFLKYDQGKKLSWWFSYARARAEERVVDIEFDGLLVEQTGTLRRINNQDHTVYADVNYRPNSRWHINLSWQYYTGWPLTTYDYVANRPYTEAPAPDLHMAATHNQFRGEDYPAYHRMDIRVNRDIRLGDATLKVYLHIINVYNRENLRKFDVDSTDDDVLVADGQGSYQYFRDDTTWFGRIPVLGVTYDF
ncbi:MAG: TonB-dependent receptor [Gemmatimonadetes bacterium]|jgi:outer membrane receptor for ferrienterochelin and colicin|nr:TonB-dependent receptor [Gemmatimonadota bacterium]MBT4612061.1 TonB-dependent receptor [Gemmatimonadota bacterium]MBT5060577.1 TonB-dependent receptor [Gemmatimonadota bacterium]MBT5146256.1 TonB-dependent receptor [Gemmatimonadota bacterium]MBT5588978.1 TonB-dependent receptor [Gemmatimonadota bacterium]